MKYLKLYENFNKKLDDYFFHEDGMSYLYHFTLSDNVDSIMDSGLIPRKYPNSNYPDGCQGVFLTTKNNTYSANLPTVLIEQLEDFYNQYGDEEPDLDESPLTIMRIRVDNLDPSKFRPDDDYVRNIFKDNKAKTLEEQVIESLHSWSAVCYVDEIPLENIIDYFPIL